MTYLKIILSLINLEYVSSLAIGNNALKVEEWKRQVYDNVTERAVQEQLEKATTTEKRKKGYQKRVYQSWHIPPNEILPGYLPSGGWSRDTWERLAELAELVIDRYKGQRLLEDQIHRRLKSTKRTAGWRRDRHLLHQDVLEVLEGLWAQQQYSQANMSIPRKKRRKMNKDAAEPIHYVQTEPSEIGYDISHAPLVSSSKIDHEENDAIHYNANGDDATAESVTYQEAISNHNSAYDEVRCDDSRKDEESTIISVEQGRDDPLASVSHNCLANHDECDSIMPPDNLEFSTLRKANAHSHCAIPTLSPYIGWSTGSEKRSSGPDVSRRNITHRSCSFSARSCNSYQDSIARPLVSALTSQIKTDNFIRQRVGSPSRSMSSNLQSPATPEPANDQYSPYRAMSAPVDIRSTLAAALKSLEDGCDLTSTALQLLLQDFKPSSFHVMDPAFLGESWPSRPIKKLDLQATSIMLPLHHSTPRHWTIAHCDLVNRTVDHYDSLPSADTFSDARKRLEEFLTLAFDTEAGLWNIRCHSYSTQANINDCGVYAVLAAIHLMNDLDPPVDLPECSAWRVVFRAVLCQEPQREELSRLFPMSEPSVMTVLRSHREQVDLTNFRIRTWSALARDKENLDVLQAKLNSLGFVHKVWKDKIAHMEELITTVKHRIETARRDQSRYESVLTTYAQLELGQPRLAFLKEDYEANLSTIDAIDEQYACLCKAHKPYKVAVQTIEMVLEAAKERRGNSENRIVEARRKVTSINKRIEKLESEVKELSNTF